MFSRFRYPLTVFLIAAPLFAVYTYPYSKQGVMDKGMRWYLSGYARVVGAVLSLFDHEVLVADNKIIGRAFAMRIVKTCDAMEVVILLVAALIALSMPWARRVGAVIAAVATMLALNILRLCILYWVGSHSQSWFDRIHQTLAPLFLVGSALALFFLSLPKPRPSCPPDTGPGKVMP